VHVLRVPDRDLPGVSRKEPRGAVPARDVLGPGDQQLDLRAALAGLWLFITATFGLIFVGFQSYEFTEFYSMGLSLEQNLYGTTFFVLTGFHGAHVSGGVLWLLSLFVMNARGMLGPEKALDVELCGLYWNFVDIVWIVIFTVVYLVEFAR
jgi:heme/copper-type cytochrome/quinol oxidase subunit 3